MKNENVISSTTFERLKPMCSHIPLMYELPKVYKVGVPLKPILDMSNSPHHPVAQWLANILEPLRKSLSPHSIRHTFDFVDYIADINVTGKRMVSFDNNSLFTNVPLTNTINYLCKKVEELNADIGIPISYLQKTPVPMYSECTISV